MIQIDFITCKYKETLQTRHNPSAGHVLIESDGAGNNVLAKKKKKKSSI